MQVINESLQRRMLHPNTFWLGNAVGNNSLLQDTGRQLLLHQQQQQHGQQVGVEVGGPGQISSGSPVIHSLGAPSLGGPTQSASLFSVHRPPITTGRVRAPISPVPSGIPLQEALHRTLPPGGAVQIPPAIFNQSPLRS